MGRYGKLIPKAQHLVAFQKQKIEQRKKTEENFCSEANCEYQNGKDALGTEKPFLEHPQTFQSTEGEEKILEASK